MKTILLIFLTTLNILSCTPSVPKCGDGDTVTLIKQIARDYLGPDDKKIRLTMAVNAVRTTNTNVKTGAHQCAANLQLTFITQEGTFPRSLPITYTVEKTDNDEDIYVQVFGIQAIDQM